MIGTQLYQKKSRVNLFLGLYGGLTFIGIAYIVLVISRQQDVPGAAGFMVVFGAGMCFMTWLNSRKPRVIVREEFVELNQQRKPQYIRYKGISTVTRMKDGRLVIAVRDGHDINNVMIWLKELEDADADKLVAFFQNKGWKVT